MPTTKCPMHNHYDVNDIKKHMVAKGLPDPSDYLRHFFRSYEKSNGSMMTFCFLDPAKDGFTFEPIPELDGARKALLAEFGDGDVLVRYWW